MKILFTHRFYYPDTAPYALMLRTIAKSFADGENQVHVFASKPSYRTVGAASDLELDTGVSLSRCWVFQENKANIVTRILNVLIYSTALFLAVLKRKPDVVTASTFPPVVAGWSASLAARLVGAKFIYHMMDIHPEVSQVSGGRLGRGLAFRLLRWLDNQTLRRSAAIIVLSEDMAATLRARGVADLPIHIINNFLLETFESAPNDKPAPNKSGKRQIIFAGNFGRFQDLPLLTEGVALCLERHPEVELLLLGNGAEEDRLKERWKDHPQIRFSPFVPFAEAQAIIANADIGLVSITPNVYRVSYPSKMLTYLGLGVPVLALVEPESHMARAVVSAGLGVVPTERSPEAIATALEALLQRKDGLKKQQRDICNWVLENGCRDAALLRWQRIVQEVGTV